MGAVSEASAGSRDRAVGALLGLACGDAVGASVEFFAPGTFPPLTDMIGGGPFNLDPGQWTDDTSMALCLAESLLDRDGHDPADQMRRYALWRGTGYFSSTGSCFDIGSTTASQIARFNRTGEPVDPSPNQEACANGSLMRLAPVPIRWHRSVADAAVFAGESSRPTHAADRPVDTCRVFGAMIAALIGGTPADEVLHPHFWDFGQLHPAVLAVARGSWRGKQPPAIRGTGYCIDAMEAAIWAVAGADDFRGAVLRAANLGDDADTTAAIAGQLAGAMWGVSAIPADWAAKVTRAERIRSLASCLHDAGAPAGASGGEARDEPAVSEVPHAPAGARFGYLSDAPAGARLGFGTGAWVADAPAGASGAVLAGNTAHDVDGDAARHLVNVLLDHGVRTFVDVSDQTRGDVTTHARGRVPDAELIASIADTRRLEVRVEHSPADAAVDLIDAARARGGVYVQFGNEVTPDTSLSNALDHPPMSQSNPPT